MRACFLCFLLSLLAPATVVLAAEAAGRPSSSDLSTALTAELLASTGTAAIFDSPLVQAAVADPGPFLGAAAMARRQRLLSEAGFRRWLPPKVWLLQARTEAGVEHWDNLAAAFSAAAQVRGYSLVTATPLPSTESAITFLSPGKAHPGLSELLAAYGADVVVLLRGRQWVLWHPDYSRHGTLSNATIEILPDILAETLAAQQQWPEAHGRTLVQVRGVNKLADFAGVEAALQALPGVQQLQLTRAEPGNLWFALSAPQGQALKQALDGELSLPAARSKVLALSSRVREAYWLLGALHVRSWRPEAVLTKLPETPASSVQLPIK